MRRTWRRTGTRAWRASTRSSTRLVITDFLMPGLTGLEVAEAIRARGHTTPIVMISGSASLHDERRAVEAGLRFLRKPITFAQFEATMAEVVEHAQAVRQVSGEIRSPPLPPGASNPPPPLGAGLASLTVRARW